MSGDFRDVIVQDCYVDDRIGWSTWIWSVEWSLGDLVGQVVIGWFAWIWLIAWSCGGLHGSYC